MTFLHSWKQVSMQSISLWYLEGVFAKDLVEIPNYTNASPPSCLYGITSEPRIGNIFQKLLEQDDFFSTTMFSSIPVLWNDGGVSILSEKFRQKGCWCRKSFNYVVTMKKKTLFLVCDSLVHANWAFRIKNLLKSHNRYWGVKNITQKSCIKFWASVLSFLLHKLKSKIK